MPGPLHHFMADDHARLDELLRRSVAHPERVDTEAYEEFRAGLLRHIAMEEKVLFPEARRLRGGQPLPAARQLRVDHGVLASLLVPSPTQVILATVREILEAHNELEEGPDGPYSQCEELAGLDAAQLLARIQAVPEVPLAPHFDGPRIQQHIDRLLEARRRKEF